MSTIKLTIAIPTAGTCRMGFAYSLAGMISKVAAQGIVTLPEATVELTIDVVESSNWITNREQLVSRAIEHGKTHLMFIDDDMVFEPNILDVMLGRRQKIVCTNYLIKTEACDSFVAVGLDGKRVTTSTESTGMIPIAYSGFGASVFDLDVFKSIAQPWFMPIFVPEKNSYTTEDNPFYASARAAGHIVYLDHDASKLVSHLGGAAWRWSDYNG